MCKAYITSIGGNLVAECGDMRLYLDDAGIRGGFCFGESVELERKPEDEWELADMLSEKAEVM